MKKANPKIPEIKNSQPKIPKMKIPHIINFPAKLISASQIFFAAYQNNFRGSAKFLSQLSHFFFAAQQNNFCGSAKQTHFPKQTHGARQKNTSQNGSALGPDSATPALSRKKRPQTSRRPAPRTGQLRASRQRLLLRWAGEMLLLPCPGPKAPLEEETAKSIFFLSLFFPKSFCKLFLLNRGHLVVLAVSAPRGPVRPTVPAPTRAYPCLPGGAACAAAPSRGGRGRRRRRRRREKFSRVAGLCASAISAPGAHPSRRCV